MRLDKHPRNSRGAALIMAIIISVIITGIVLALAWSVGQQAQSAGSLSKLDATFYAAESGAQRVAWYCKSGQMSSIASPITGTVNGYNYSTSWTTVSGSTIRITSTGSLGIVSSKLSVDVTPPTGLPVLATGMDFENKNLDVIGNVITGGNYSNAGSGSLTGNLTTYGHTSGTGSVTGSITLATGSFPQLDMVTLGANLVAAQGATYNGNQSNKTFDFTALAGTNKVIYVNGNVSNPTFIGAGTLYVNGTVTVDSFGTSSNPVNIVASGDINTNNGITMYGSLYTASGWNRSKFNLTGIIYVAGAVATSNWAQSNLTLSTIPWFDPRVPSGATSVTTFTRFSGPNP